MIHKAAVFVDGENLVFRFQEMIKAGRTPRADVIHIPNVFVWRRDVLVGLMTRIERLTYYTFATGDQDHIDELTDQIQAAQYSHQAAPKLVLCDPVVARVFKKPSSSHKSRMVDISITLDALVATFTHDIDMVILLTGDGDFEPLVREIARRGKKVHVHAFSSGLNPILRRCGDAFGLLDSQFFRKSQGEKGEPNQALQTTPIPRSEI